MKKNPTLPLLALGSLTAALALSVLSVRADTTSTNALNALQREAAYSRLAADRASDPAVRSFASQLANQPADTSGWRTTSADVSGMPNANRIPNASEPAFGNGTAVDSTSNQLRDSSGRYGTNAKNPEAGETASRPSQNVTDAVAVDSTTRNVAADDSWTRDDKPYQKLSGKSGRDFDKAYLDLVIDAHKQAISQAESQTKRSDATTMNPGADVGMLRQQLAEAKRLKKNL